MELRYRMKKMNQKSETLERIEATRSSGLVRSPGLEMETELAAILKAWYLCWYLSGNEAFKDRLNGFDP